MQQKLKGPLSLATLPGRETSGTRPSSHIDKRQDGLADGGAGLVHARPASHCAAGPAARREAGRRRDTCVGCMGGGGADQMCTARLIGESGIEGVSEELPFVFP